jgi:hypothetical protein
MKTRISLIAAAALFAAPALATTTLTPADAKRIATAVELRASDLPGYRAVPDPYTAADERQAVRYAACYGGISPAKALAIAGSSLFARLSAAQELQINSATEVLPSAALAAEDTAASFSPRGLRCAQSQLERLLHTGSAGNAHATLLPTVLPGAKDSYDVRVVIHVRVTDGSTRISVPTYDDTFGFVDGAAEVGANILSAPRPPSTSLERTLIQRLAARAKAAIG